MKYNFSEIICRNKCFNPPEEGKKEQFNHLKAYTFTLYLQKYRKLGSVFLQHYLARAGLEYILKLGLNVL